MIQKSQDIVSTRQQKKRNRNVKTQMDSKRREKSNWSHSHVIQGNRPSKKATIIAHVKRYRHDAVIASDGLLVLKDHPLFQAPRELIVVPRSVHDGLLTALRIQSTHPSKYQTKRLFIWYFYALDLDKPIDAVFS